MLKAMDVKNLSLPVKMALRMKYQQYKDTTALLNTTKMVASRPELG
jgi:hypothetical protein